MLKIRTCRPLHGEKRTRQASHTLDTSVPLSTGILQPASSKRYLLRPDVGTSDRTSILVLLDSFQEN